MPAGRRRAVSASIGLPWGQVSGGRELVETGLDPRRDGALETSGLLVGLGPAQPDERGEQPLEQGVTTEDRIGGGASGRREMEIASLGLGDEAVGDESLEHLARGLGGDAKVTADLGCGHPRAVAGHHPEGEEVLLGGAEQVRRT